MRGRGLDCRVTVTTVEIGELSDVSVDVIDSGAVLVTMNGGQGLKEVFHQPHRGRFSTF